MVKDEMPSEYHIAGSRELSFENNPKAALQCLVGGLLPAQPPMGKGLGVNGRRLQLEVAPDSPKGLTAYLELNVASCRDSLDVWDKLSKKLLSGKALSESTDFLDALSEARENLQRDCLSLTHALIPTGKALVICACEIGEEPFHRFLGIPTPVNSQVLVESCANWVKVLADGRAFECDQDPEFPQMLAHIDHLTSEMLESLKEITLEATWLLTNEPTQHRIGALLEWLHDLRCECMEIVPLLACIEAPIAAWQIQTQPEPQQKSVTPAV